MRSTGEGARSRLEMMDGLRFVAAISVVGFHLTARTSPGWGGDVPTSLESVGRWAAFGELGVPLFFVISGFVLLMTAWDKKLPSFVASRVGRLFPAYWAGVAVSVVIGMFLWPEGQTWLGRLVTKPIALLNGTMVQSAFNAPVLDGPAWTLWYELRFYFLIALLMLVGINRRRVLAFATLWPIVGALANVSENKLLITFLMPDFSCYFAGGMLLYLIYRDGHDLGTWLLVGFQAVIGVYGNLPAYKAATGQYVTWGRSPTLLAVAIVGCFAAVAFVTLTPMARRRYRWMTPLGALTYPLYLIHENLGWYTIHLTNGRVGPWGAVLAALTVCLVGAIGIHVLVERPLGPRLRRATMTMLLRDAKTPAAGTAIPARIPTPETPSEDDRWTAPVSDPDRPMPVRGPLTMPPEPRRAVHTGSHLGHDQDDAPVRPRIRADLPRHRTSGLASDPVG